jgi:hypothetical protein
MDKLIKAISSVAPFLAPYPPWVKGAFALWILATAFLLIGLVLGRPSSSDTANGLRTSSDTTGTSEPAGPSSDANSQPAAQRVQQEVLWLIIDRVEFFAAKPGVQIRLTADVNGTQFIYPSRAGIQWLEVGPSMAAQAFRLPPTDRRYAVRFEALVRIPATDTQPQINGELKSVNEQIIDIATDLPYAGRYILHTFDPVHMARSANAEAEVRFRISDAPR